MCKENWSLSFWILLNDLVQPLHPPRALKLVICLPLVSFLSKQCNIAKSWHHDETLCNEESKCCLLNTTKRFKIYLKSFKISKRGISFLLACWTRTRFKGSSDEDARQPTWTELPSSTTGQNGIRKKWDAEKTCDNHTGAKLTGESSSWTTRT